MFKNLKRRTIDFVAGIGLFMSFRTYSIKLYLIFVGIFISSLSFSSLNIGKISIFTKYADFYLKAILQNCSFFKKEQNRAADFSCTITRDCTEYIKMNFGSGSIELHIYLPNSRYLSFDIQAENIFHNCDFQNF